MNGDRLFRGLVTLLTLLVCLAVLRQWFSASSSDVASASAITRQQPAPPVAEPVPVDPAPIPDVQTPVEIASLPFLALDNLCFDGSPRDLSRCTSMLSGGLAREYDLQTVAGRSLEILLEPRDPDFDVSLAVLNSDGECLAGRDVNGAGMSETVTIADLPGGLCHILVGSYDNDCGPYSLTVRDAPAPIAQVCRAVSLTGPNGTAVRWQTFAEMDLRYFSLYRCTATSRERIAVFRAHGSRAGFADYRFMDRARIPGSTYELEAVASDGRTERLTVPS
jgi:hypothetical protein